MDGNTIYKYMEFIIFSLYLLFVYLSAQMLFMWVDVDKIKLKSRIFEQGTFLRNSIIFVFLAGLFFIFHELVAETIPPNYLNIEFLELLTFVFIEVFMYKWYLNLKSCTPRKPAYEYILESCRNPDTKVVCSNSFLNKGILSRSALLLVFCLITLVLALFVPISSIFFVLLMGFLFIPPFLVLASTLIGASMITKELGLGKVNHL
ncbi:Uncharacterised protein [uncultured archaeon]|nr:Uncharacterised protein [uncultured archaeon]